VAVGSRQPIEATNPSRTGHAAVSRSVTPPLPETQSASRQRELPRERCRPIPLGGKFLSTDVCSPAGLQAEWHRLVPTYRLTQPERDPTRDVWIVGQLLYHRRSMDLTWTPA
jgi:hypothetical protein